METGDGEGCLLQRLMGRSQIPSPTLSLFLNGDQMDILVLKLFSPGLILIQSLTQRMKLSGGNEAGVVGTGGTVVCIRGGRKAMWELKDKVGVALPPSAHTQNESRHESEGAGSWYSDTVLPATFPLHFLLPKPGSPSLALH